MESPEKTLHSRARTGPGIGSTHGGAGARFYPLTLARGLPYWKPSSVIATSGTPRWRLRLRVLPPSDGVWLAPIAAIDADMDFHGIPGRAFQSQEIPRAGRGHAVPACEAMTKLARALAGLARRGRSSYAACAAPDRRERAGSSHDRASSARHAESGSLLDCRCVTRRRKLLQDDDLRIVGAEHPVRRRRPPGRNARFHSAHHADTWPGQGVAPNG